MHWQWRRPVHVGYLGVEPRLVANPGLTTTVPGRCAADGGG